MFKSRKTETLVKTFSYISIYILNIYAGTRSLIVFKQNVFVPISHPIAAQAALDATHDIRVFIADTCPRIPISAIECDSRFHHLDACWRYLALGGGSTHIWQGWPGRRRRQSRWYRQPRRRRRRQPLFRRRRRMRSRWCWCRSSLQDINMRVEVFSFEWPFMHTSGQCACQQGQTADQWLHGNTGHQYVLH